MKATRWALQIMLILLVGLAFASAALAANNFIKIVNNCNNKIVFYYKCYNNNPWDQNTGCPMDNTMNQVEAGKSWTKATPTTPSTHAKRSISAMAATTVVAMPTTRN